MASQVAKYDHTAVASAEMQSRAERRLRAWLEGALSKNTAIAYTADLGVFAAHLGALAPDGHPSPGAALGWLITLAPHEALEVAEGWQSAMIAAGLSAATINRRVVSLNAALRHLAKGGVGAGKLDVGQLKREARKEVEAPSTGSISRVVEDLSASTAPAAIRDVLIVLLGAQRGLRKSEIAALSVEDVDGNTCTVKVRRKGHREKVALSIEGAACEALQRWLAIRPDYANPDEPALFVALGNRARGRGLSGQAIYNVFQSRGDWHPHQLRHSAIEEVLRSSKNNLALAQALAGHAAPSTTMAYIGKRERKRIEGEAVGTMSRVYRLSKLKPETD